MLDLKALLSKVLNALTISETVTFTKFNKGWQFSRIGRVVYVYAPNDISGNVPAGFSTIGTLPTSMRPSGVVYLGVTNAGTLDYRLTVNNAGVVQYYQPSATSSAHNAGFCGYSFITNGGYLTSKFYSIFSHLERWWEHVRFKGFVGENIKSNLQSVGLGLLFRRFKNITCKWHTDKGERKCFDGNSKWIQTSFRKLSFCRQLSNGLLFSKHSIHNTRRKFIDVSNRESYKRASDGYTTISNFVRQNLELDWGCSAC